MLTLEDFGTIFLLVSFLGSLAFSYPAWVYALPLRSGERFSELYILGSGHMAEDYPFNVKAGETYRIYLGIGNHMGSSAYYCLQVKLRNQTEPLPNSTMSQPSPLPSLYEYRIFLSDGGVWETMFSFSFNDLSFLGNTCSVESLRVDSLDFSISKTASWNLENKGYYLELFFELWIYDPESNGFSYHNRFVGLWLNMTG